MWLYDETEEYLSMHDPDKLVAIKTMDDDKYKELLLENGGCGVTAVTDLILYLSLMNGRYSDLTTDVTYNSDKVVDYDSYIAFYKQIAFDYIRFPVPNRNLHGFEIYFLTFCLIRFETIDVNNWPGLYSYQLTDGFNKYAKGTGLELNFNNLDYYGSDISSFSKDIKSSILEGIPVIFFLSTDEEKKTAEERETDEDAMVKCKKITLYDYNSESYIKTTLHSESSATSHFMNITGVIYDDIVDEYYYILSSWGKPYVISATELIDTCSDAISKKDAGFFFLKKYIR